MIIKGRRKGILFLSSLIIDIWARFNFTYTHTDIAALDNDE